MQTILLQSRLDPSRNWLIPYGKNKLECRYVRRTPDKISLYVSSHNGCIMGCKFCYLTNQKEKDFKSSSQDMYVKQVETVLDHLYYSQDPNMVKHREECALLTQSYIPRVNINFMARGEPMANTSVVYEYPQLYENIKKTLLNYNIKKFRMNISTIMPKNIKNKSLCDMFQDSPAYMYYSLYSIDEKFRSKWLPNAMPYLNALDALKKYQDKSGLPITFHWAFIKNENDNLDSIHRMANILKLYDFDSRLNIVQYNPHPETNTLPIDDIQLDKIIEILSKSFGSIKVIPRVGYDIAASCGMFIK